MTFGEDCIDLLWIGRVGGLMWRKLGSLRLRPRNLDRLRYMRPI